MNAIENWGYVLAAIAGITASTLLTRSSFFVLPASINLPPQLERALRFAPACALTAIIVPGVLTRDGEPYFSLGNNQLWATLVACAVFAKTRNMLAMMCVGMGVFTALRLWV